MWSRFTLLWMTVPLFVLMTVSLPAGAANAVDAATQGAMPWWVWPLALFAVCFLMGIVAVPAGVGGGVLFVPIIGGFFPFHLDFVRGAGLLVALASALSASPALLRNGLASLRLALPLGLLVSISSIAGAFIGLALPEPIAQTALGVTILAIVVLMWTARRSEFPESRRNDPLAMRLGLQGVFHDLVRGKDVSWEAHRTLPGLIAFAFIGLLAGMFGLGAGWANGPVLNLVMGVPIKVAIGTSSLILSMASSAAWVYINEGAVLSIIAVPSVIGMMLGAKIGARLLHVLSAQVVRRMVVTLLLFAGLRALAKGLIGWI
jgi:uncharacterized membrane protein YfcA